MRKFKGNNTKRLVAIILTLILMLPVQTAFAAESSSPLDILMSSNDETSDIADIENDIEDEDNVEISEPEEDAESSDIEDEEVDDDTEPFDANIPPLKTGGHDTYMQGYKDGTFLPNAKMKRAEVSTVIYNLLTTKPTPVKGQFNDVDDDAWYGNAINSLASVGIVNGKKDKIFEPNGMITRAEVATILSKFYPKKTASNPFPDLKDSHWAYDALITAYSYGWLKGDSSTNALRPNDTITRVEVVTIMNRVLEREETSATLKRKFKDVSDSHWGFRAINEAATPLPGTEWTEPTNPAPTGDKVIVTGNGVNFRAEANTNCSVLKVLYSGVILDVIDTSVAGWTKAKHSDGTVGYISNDYIKAYDGAQPPEVTGDISVALYKYYHIQGSVDGSMSNARWKSDDPSIASVHGYNDGSSNIALRTDPNGYCLIYGKKQGTTNVHLTDKSGNIKKTYKVVVKAPEAVRFISTTNINPTKNQKFTLKAITDTSKTGVKFVVSGAGSGTYETSTSTTEKQTNTGYTDNSAKVFTKEVSFGTAGSYVVKAYSKDSSGNWSSDYCSFNMLVNSSSGSLTETTTSQRSVTNEMIDVIKTYEGSYTLAYLDKLASTNVITAGYGFVVYNNESFYNNLTISEQNAMLQDTINNGSYVKVTEQFRKNNNVKMSQCQFDALVSFAYNLGPYSIDEKYTTFRIMMNASSTINNVSASNPQSGKTNAGDAKMYANATATGTALATVPNGTSVSVTEVKHIKGDVNNLWYKITYSGKTGWIRGGNVRFTNRGTVDLAYVDEQMFGSNLLEWNSAGGNRLPGLVYRRLGESKVFCYANYAEAKNSSSNPNYRKNVGFDVPPNVPGLALK